MSTTPRPAEGARTDWKALSQRTGHADVVFTMKQHVQSDLDADRQVATALAKLIIGESLASVALTSEGESRAGTGPENVEIGKWRT